VNRILPGLKPRTCSQSGPVGINGSAAATLAASPGPARIVAKPPRSTSPIGPLPISAEPMSGTPLRSSRLYPARTCTIGLGRAGNVGSIGVSPAEAGTVVLDSIADVSYLD
jgi:hypothetical protein